MTLSSKLNSILNKQITGGTILSAQDAQNMQGMGNAGMGSAVNIVNAPYPQPFVPTPPPFTLEVRRAANGYVVHCNKTMYIASDVDALMDVVKQAMVSARLEEM